LRKNGFEAGSAAEVDAELGNVGKWNGESDGGGFLLASEVGFRSLFIQKRQGDALLADKIKSGGAADFLEGFPKKLLLTICGGFGKEGEKLAFFGATRPDFGKGGHGVAPNLFGRIGQEREEPLSNGFFEGGLRCLGKSRADSTDKSDGAELFIRRCRVEARDFLFPKAEPWEGAEFSIQIFRGMSGLLGHKGASVWRGRNSSPA
jgi:hypothetical protein